MGTERILCEIFLEISLENKNLVKPSCYFALFFIHFNKSAYKDVFHIFRQ